MRIAVDRRLCRGGNRRSDPTAGLGPGAPGCVARGQVATDRANTAIAGLTMGGSQTLNIALAHPDRFACVGVYSSGLFGVFPVGGRGGATAPVPSGPAEWEKRNAAVLGSTSIAPVYRESAGGHTWPNWRDYLDAFAPRLFQ